MPLAMLFSTVLVLVTVLIHYEVLRVASDLLPRLSRCRHASVSSW